MGVPSVPFPGATAAASRTPSAPASGRPLLPGRFPEWLGVGKSFHSSCPEYWGRWRGSVSCTRHWYLWICWRDRARCGRQCRQSTSPDSLHANPSRPSICNTGKRETLKRGNPKNIRLSKHLSYVKLSPFLETPPTRKSSPWGNFSNGGLNQPIKRRLSLWTFGWLIDWR